MHEAPAVEEGFEAREQNNSVAEDDQERDTTAAVADHFPITQVVTETTTTVTETIREQAVFDLNIGVENVEIARTVPEQEGIPTAGEVYLSRSVWLPGEAEEATAGDSLVQADEADARDAQNQSDRSDEEVAEVTDDSAEEVDEDGNGTESGENGDAASVGGESLSEEESGAEEVEEEDVGEVEDEDEYDTREDEPDDEGPTPTIREKIWDFLTT